MTTIDAAKYHHGNGAASEEDAAWHIGVFLLWCGERGLLAASHALEKVRTNPTRYVLKNCSGKLWSQDLSPKGADFASQAYGNYLNEVSDIAIHQGVSAYGLRALDRTDEVVGWLFEHLDGAYKAHNTT
jgi:hypothetical protein